MAVSLREVALEAGRGLRRAQDEALEREREAKRLEQFDQMVRDADEMLGELGEQVVKLESDLTVVLPDGLLLAYRPESYDADWGGRREAKFFFAERCGVCGALVWGEEVASRHSHGSLARLGLAIEAGVRHVCEEGLSEPKPVPPSADELAKKCAEEAVEFIDEGDSESGIVYAVLAVAHRLSSLERAVYWSAGER